MHIEGPARSVRTLFTPLVVLSSLPAQLQWVQNPSPGPSARFSYAMAYDPVRQQTVLFGGTGPGGQGAFLLFNDTWILDRNGWRLACSSCPPSARSSMAMAYCAVRRTLILFGGSNGTMSFNDTWEWNGVNWQQLTPATSPSARVGHAMVDFTAAGQSVLLFGGSLTGSASLDDLWAWDGQTWREIPRMATWPAVRQYHMLAHDAGRNEVVLHGGNPQGPLLYDTWVWNGVLWVQDSDLPAVARESAGFAYDSLRGVCVLFGGYDGTGTRNETWEWDGSAWYRPSLSPPIPAGRYHHDLAYDAERRCVVLFGGYDGAPRSDTWEYFVRGSCTKFGFPCQGANGVVPCLECPMNGPAIGEPFTMCVRDRCMTSIPPTAVLWIFGAQRWPFPIDLTAIGMPGCALFASLDLSIVLANCIAPPFVVPLNPGLLGVHLFVQAFPYVPSLNRFIASDAADLLIGAR